jgi:type I restriction enzyme, S subunit
MGTSFVPFSELLSEVVDNRGRTCPTADTGIPLIATNCIRNDFLYPRYERVRYVSRDTYKTWFRGHPKPGDLIFVLKGTPGRVCFAPDPIDFCIAQDMVALRADQSKVDPKYLFALLRSPQIQSKIEQMHVGTLIPHFKKGDFGRLLLPIPNRSAQQFIGDVYFTLSSKIDLNRRINETVEAAARALFKSWFVDFDPVRAKAERRDPGVSSNISDLFPDSFDLAESGEIPKGWQVRAVGELATVTGGSTPSTKEESYWQGGTHCWATPKDLSALRTPVLLDTERRITDTGLSQIASGLLAPGALLLSSRAPIGYLAIAEIPVAINQGFIAMRAAPGVSNLFLLRWAEWAHDLIVSRANGSTFLEISKSNFRPIPIATPPDRLMNAFDQLVRPLYARVVNNELSSRTLAQLRDALLPKLLSGELRVKDSERIIGRSL